VRLEKGLGRDNRVPKQAAGQPSELPEGGHSMSIILIGGARINAPAGERPHFSRLDDVLSGSIFSR
jgi:hypothetical protein